MRILLINPSGRNMLIGNNPAFIDQTRGCNFPIGLGYLASYLLQYTNHYVRIFDCQVEQDLDFQLAFGNYDLVGISATSFVMKEVVEIVNKVRRFSKGTKVVLGGVHPTLYPNETLNLSVDYVIQGEGENVLPELIDTFFKTDQRIFKGELENNLDNLPFPLRTNISSYNSIFSDKLSTIIITSRGCPYQCRFCWRPVFGKHVRFRSYQNIVDELSYCRSRGIRDFMFYDDTFTIDKPRLVNLCNEVNKRKLKIRFDIRSRVDTIDKNILTKLKQIGLVQIHLGVESGSQLVLNRMQKGITLQQIEKAFLLCKKLRIKTLAYIMIGCPDETEDDIGETIKLVNKIKPDYLHATIFTLMPGSAFYQEWLERGNNDVWRNYATDPCKDFTPPIWGDIDRERLEVILDTIYRRFYLRSFYLAKRLAEVRSLNKFKKYIKAGVRLLK